MKDFLNTRTQSCWQERLQKEMLARLAWKVKYGHDYPGVGVPSGRRRREVKATGSPAPKPGLPEISALKAPSVEDKVEAIRELSARSKAFTVEMRPPSPQTLKLLYQDGSGREQYLQRRKLKNPEEKFHYPILTSWAYGWHFGDVVKENKAPIYGRSGIVKDTFFQKNGICWQSSKTDRLL
ncbi:protein ATP6V1FNB [Rhinatrema bivittatum]|uniref:protein ATP6V1FNB n=1 Tax=Rhinatrema bivittatum TaxID=194408 RepID=UPI00112A177D|nr:protein ATP6V1FNB [Rhinatrema bivittatum]